MKNQIEMKTLILSSILVLFFGCMLVYDRHNFPKCNRHELTESIKKVLENEKIEDKENLHLDIINSILNDGIASLRNFKNSDLLMKLESLQNAFRELLDKMGCENESKKINFRKFIITFLKNHEIADANNLYLNIENFISNELLQSFEELDIKNYQKYSLKESILSNKLFKIEENIQFYDFYLFIKNLLKSKKISDTGSLITKLSKSFLDSFSSSLDKYKTQIQTKQFNAMKYTINDYAERIKFFYDLNFKQRLMHLKQSIVETPNCTEKTLSSLILHSELKFLNKGILSEMGFHFKSEEIIDEIIDDELRLLNKQLIEEEFANKVSMKAILRKRSSSDWKAVIFELESILKKIRPLDIRKMTDLIDMSKKTSNAIKDQNIVLFLGVTGSGKSTTIQFLAGSKMILKRVEISPGVFLDHIDALPNNSKIDSVKIGFQAKSETQSVTAIPVNLRDFGLPSDKSFLLCDTPGFGDTGGPEVDIANGVGIVDAVKGSKSVVPVILSSYKSVGDKGEGIKLLAHLLVGMISDINDKLNAFYYLFTKYPANIDIHAVLLNIYNSIKNNPEEKDDKSFIALIEDMRDKTKADVLKQRMRIDPINDNPLNILKDISALEPIENPKETFKFSISEVSKNAIREHVRIDQLSIRNSVIRENYDLIIYKMSELKKLNEILKDPFIKNAFEDSKKHLCQHFETKFLLKKESINRNLKNKNTLELSEILEYKNSIKRFDLDVLKELDLNIIDHEVISQNLMQKMNEVIENLSHFVFNTTELLVNLDGVKFLTGLKVDFDNSRLLADNFIELRPKYTELCQLFIHKIEFIQNILEDHMKKNDFNEIAAKINLVFQSKLFLHEHLPKMELIFDSIKNKVLSYFNSITDKCEKIIVEKEKLSKTDVETLNNSVNILNAAKESFLSKDFIDTKKSYDSCILIIKGFFEKLNNKVRNIVKLEKESLFKEIGIVVKEMDIIRNISGMEYVTSESYYQTKDEILGYVKILEREAKQDLEKETQEYIKLKNFIFIQENNPWLNDFLIEIDFMQNIINKAFEKAKEYEEKVLDLDLSLDHYINLKEAANIIQKLDKLRQFETFAPKIAPILYSSLEKLDKSISDVFDFIEKNFNFLEISDEELKNMQSGYSHVLPQKYFSIETNNLNKTTIDEVSEPVEQFQTINNPYQTENIKYFIFKKLDVILVQSSLSYLNSCSEVRFSKNKAKIVKDKFYAYIQAYAEAIENEIDENMSKILNEEQETIENDMIEKLKRSIHELLEIKKYPDVEKIFKAKEKFTGFVSKLSKHFTNIRDQLEDAASNDNNELKIKLGIVNSFREFDEFFETLKYNELYQQYQKKLNQGLDDFCKEIIILIDQKNYDKVASKLLAIEKTLISKKILIKIKETLVESVKELTKKTETNANFLESSLPLAETQSIFGNLQKLENVQKHFSKSELSNYFDQAFLEQLKVDFENIQKLISKKIIKFLEHTEALIDNNNFHEAENRREYLSNINHDFEKFCKNEEAEAKLENITKKLEDMIENVLKKYAQLKLEDYILDPPKAVLENLEKVSHRNVNYAKCLKEVEKSILDHIREKIQNAKNAQLDERNAIIRKVNASLNSLPEKIKNVLAEEILNFVSHIMQIENEYQSDYDRIIAIGDIKALCKFMEKCSKNGIIQLIRVAQEEILKQAHNCKENILKALDEDDIKKALKISQKIFEFHEYFIKYVSQIENIYIEVSNRLVKKFDKVLDTLTFLETIEDVDIIVKSFNDFSEFVSFKKEVGEFKISANFIHTIDQKLVKIFSAVSKNFINQQSNFDLAFKEKNILNIRDSMNYMKKWDPFLQKIKRFLNTNGNENDIIEIVELRNIFNGKLYNDMVEETSKALQNLKHEILNFELVQKFQNERDEFYENLEKICTFMRHVEKINNHIDKDIYDPDTFLKVVVPFIKKKFQTASDLALKTLDAFSQTTSDYDSLRILYDNLMSGDKHLRKLDIDLKSFVKKFNTKIDQKLGDLIDATEKNDSTVDDVAKNLIQMKIMADNLPFMNSKINDKIDETLKNYKSKNSGVLAIATLSGLLEQDTSGVGLTIIAEHKIFKGEIISFFNQETQRHDIDYVLKHLEGDGLDIEKIKTHYDEFESTYKSLVHKFIVFLESKRNHNDVINELASTIKLLSKKINHKPNQIKWVSTIRDKIVDLTAHIFALWTLQNTEYFVQMKGADNRDSYLLIPHPGQVIAIFRMLGIGYTDNKENKSFLEIGKEFVFKETIVEDTDGLQNNLVQVGTGEGISFLKFLWLYFSFIFYFLGKSLILGVTSSVLALLGIDVSCASYSDYLSSRDYDSFSQLFDTLGIKDLVHYGTFNKLFEDVINEDGNIRSRVLNLITQGSSEKKKVDGHHRRPKILLIDEVDVFFSKDFYGNTYNPVTLLKNSVVTNLVNYIWSTRNQKLSIKTLEQTMAYKECTTYFKEWGFLIHEAVKTMLADLNDFQHDYVIQNGRIGYRYQDSISFNHIHGYKTMFSYLYELEKEKVTKTAVEENIAIVINCGTFSYAGNKVFKGK